MDACCPRRADPGLSLAQLACWLLARAAWLAPGELIPLELLAANLPAQPKLTATALQRLIDRGLIMCGGASDHTAIRLHRLVNAYLRS